MSKDKININIYLLTANLVIWKLNRKQNSFQNKEIEAVSEYCLPTSSSSFKAQ